MSFNISSVGPGQAKPVSSSGEARAQRSAPTAPATAADASVRVDTFPSEPPPEVHAAMSIASDAYDKLQAADRQLSFQLDSGTGKLRIEVHDLRGQVLFTVPAAKALAIASGDSLD